MIFLKASPFIVIFLLGAALKIQSDRLEKSQQVLSDYKETQQQANEEYTRDLERLRTSNTAIAAAATAQLTADMDAGEVMRRCVAAGKCRSVPVKPGSCAAQSLPPITGSNANGGTAVPSTGEPTTQTVENCESLANDAAKVQLRLNLLQAEIESQLNYALEDP